MANTRGKTGAKKRTPLGQRWYDLYSQKGWSRREFAELLKIKEPSLYQIEYGKNQIPTTPKAPTTQRASRLLDTTPEYLLTGEGPQKPILRQYDQDVQDMCSLLMLLGPDHRKVVRAMIDQLVELERQGRIAR